MTKGKRYNNILEQIDRDKNYSVDEAFEIISNSKHAKFDESVDIAFSLGIDPRHADQLVRGTITLPHGSGKQSRVVVVTKDENAKTALDAGADYAGATDILEKIKGGWLDFDVIISTPDMMGELGKLGRVLGPRGLMPNPKTGTVTPDVEKAVKEVKAGKISYRCDKFGVVHSTVGRVSFEKDKLIENFKAFYETISKAKPSSSKGTYMKKVTISSTMGPGIKIDKNNVVSN